MASVSPHGLHDTCCIRPAISALLEEAHCRHSETLRQSLCQIMAVAVVVLSLRVKKTCMEALTHPSVRCSCALPSCLLRGQHPPCTLKTLIQEPVICKGGIMARAIPYRAAISSRPIIIELYGCFTHSPKLLKWPGLIRILLTIYELALVEICIIL